MVPGRNGKDQVQSFPPLICAQQQSGWLVKSLLTALLWGIPPAGPRDSTFPACSRRDHVPCILPNQEGYKGLKHREWRQGRATMVRRKMFWSLSYGNMTWGQYSQAHTNVCGTLTYWKMSQARTRSALHVLNSPPGLACWWCFSVKSHQLPITTLLASCTLGPSCVIFNLCRTCWENALNSPVPWQPEIWN